MVVRLKDIAAELGLSIVTVSRALRDHPDMSRKTRTKVLDRAKRLNYRPNLMGIGLIDSLLGSGVTEAQSGPGSLLHLAARDPFRLFDGFKARGRYIKHAQIGDHAMDDADSCEWQRAIPQQLPATMPVWSSPRP